MNELKERRETCPLCSNALRYTSTRLAEESDRMGMCENCGVYVPAYSSYKCAESADLASLTRLVVSETLDLLDRERDGGYDLSPGEWDTYIKTRLLLARTDEANAHSAEQELPTAQIPRGVQRFSMAVHLKNGDVVRIDYGRKRDTVVYDSVGPDGIMSPRVYVHSDGGAVSLGQIEHDAVRMREALHLARNYILLPGFPGLVGEDEK